MAKKKPAKPAIASIDDLKPDPKNPRRISDRAKAKLKGSLERFGDLSGITFNRRTGELVTGHQRVAKIRELWPEAEILAVDDGLGLIAIDLYHYFPVRFVDWSPAQQRAANVTANNAKIQGEFTEDVRTYLLDVHDALDEELPAIAERVRLLEWLAPADQEHAEQDVPSLYQVIVCCDGEDQQIKLCAELVGRGLQATSVVG